MPLLAPAARAAAWSLVGVAARADTRAWRHGSDPLARAGLRLATGASRPWRLAAIALLGADALPRWVARWLGRGRRALGVRGVRAG
jgi:hypothetical protein